MTAFPADIAANEMTIFLTIERTKAFGGQGYLWSSLTRQFIVFRYLAFSGET